MLRRFLSDGPAHALHPPENRSSAAVTQTQRSRIQWCTAWGMAALGFHIVVMKAMDCQQRFASAFACHARVEYN